MNLLALLILPLLLLPANAAASTAELKEFPKDMWGSFKQQGRREGIYTLFAAGAGASIARYGSRTYFDDFHVADTLERHKPLGRRAVDLGAVVGHSMYLMPVMAGTYFAGSHFESGTAAEFGLAGFEALSLAGVQTIILKYSVRRLRPDKTDFAAFPSGHTSASFALATVAASTWGWKVGVPACMAASFVGYSRMEGRSHYLSDVFFGAGLGIISGRAVFHYRKDAQPNRYTFVPFISPGGGGVTMAF